MVSITSSLSSHYSFNNEDVRVNPEHRERLTDRFKVRLERTASNVARLITTFVKQIFCLEFFRSKPRQRAMGKEMVNPRTFSSVNDIKDMEKNLKNGDLIFFCDGPQSWDPRVAMGQWTAGIFTTDVPIDDNSHLWGHTAMFYRDDKGDGYVIEAGPPDKHEWFGNLHNDVRRVPFSNYCDKKLQPSDSFYQVVRPKDQQMAKKTADLACKLSVRTKIGDENTKSPLKYAYIGAAGSLLFSTEVTKHSVRDALQSSLLAYKDEITEDDKNKLGTMFCSQFTGWSLQIHDTKRILAILGRKYTDDEDLKTSTIKDIAKDWKSKEAKQWAKRVMGKHYHEFRSLQHVRLDPAYASPMDLHGYVNEHPELYKKVISIVPDGHLGLAQGRIIDDEPILDIAS
ncbi:MAG: hypothetical protein H7A37_09455 [Chlamydiales bacterium]|nr:hypothetical protein [Chlamydiia bacterium]MCP5508503.1 hypothetical protein [Chlamydiales bacterium]